MGFNPTQQGRLPAYVWRQIAPPILSDFPFDKAKKDRQVPRWNPAAFSFLEHIQI